MSNESRRKLLKSLSAVSSAIVVGKNLPESWGKPIVDSVLLPTHALTSEVNPNGNYSGSANAQAVAIFPSDQSPFDYLVSKANADEPIFIPSDFCIEIKNKQVNVSVLINGYQIWGGTGEIDTPLSLNVIFSQKAICTTEQVSITVSIKGVGPNREAFGTLSFGFGKRGLVQKGEVPPPLPVYSVSYEIMESALDCDLLPTSIIVNCN